MRSLIAGLVILTSTPAVTLAATLPLKEGVFSRIACEARTPAAQNDIFVAPAYDPTFKSEAHISPNSEGNMGNCAIKRVKVSGNRYSGTAPCKAGSAEVPSGAYAFDYQVIDRTTFVSRGATYHWCAPHW